MIPVVDIFAGPGGLSEGFSSITSKSGSPVFDVVLSIEKELRAYKTLRLRSFFRQFLGNVPDEYYDHLRGTISEEELFACYPTQSKKASACCWHATLGFNGVTQEQVRKRITWGIGSTDEWVLIGGPPCQAYSVAGRSRNLGNPDYEPSEDERQVLYVEYLQVLAEHRPAVFVMENVKGLLSATLKNQHIFSRIIEDLCSPSSALKREGRFSKFTRPGGYRLFSLAERGIFDGTGLQGSLVKSEDFGVPQTRHRIILLGIRDDLKGITPKVLKREPEIPLSDVIGGLPKLRSGLSRQLDSSKSWIKCLKSQMNSKWANSGARKADGSELSDLIKAKLLELEPPKAKRGNEFIHTRKSKTIFNSSWFGDSRLRGVCNHQTKSHMEPDLYRYFYATCFAELHRRSPSLRHFPKCLLPNHRSVNAGLLTGAYADRFRVQVSGKPATTIVSHISKDGHYYIHPDPLQCRSLTVREAARIQTFPDNYFFCGPRTSQYIQVGNAVPPLLAKEKGISNWLRRFFHDGTPVRLDQARIAVQPQVFFPRNPKWRNVSLCSVALALTCQR